MKKQMRVWYDKEGDFVEIQFGPKKSGNVRSIGDDCFELVDELENVTGFAIFNFTKRFKKHKEVVLPLKMESA